MSANNMEIAIPNGSSEVLLKTGGRYCYKDIKVMSPIRIESGTFTPRENTLVFDVSGISPSPRFIEIANVTPTTEILYPGISTAELLPISYAAWTGSITKCVGVPKSGHIQYAVKLDNGSIQYGSNFAKVIFADEKLTFDTVSMGGIASQMFEADVTYAWTAYYWDK